MDTLRKKFHHFKSSSIENETSLIKENQSLRNDMSLLQSHIIKKKNEIHDLQKRIDSVTTEYEKKTSDLEYDNKKLQFSLSQLRRAKQRASTKQRDMTNNSDPYNDNNYNNNDDDYHSRLPDANQRLLQDRVTRQLNQIKSLRDTLEVVKKNKSTIEQEYISVTKSLDTVNKKLCHQIEQNNQLTDEINEYRDLLSSKNETIDELQIRIMENENDTYSIDINSNNKTSIYSTLFTEIVNDNQQLYMFFHLLVLSVRMDIISKNNTLEEYLPCNNSIKDMYQDLLRKDVLPNDWYNYIYDQVSIIIVRKCFHY